MRRSALLVPVLLLGLAPAASAAPTGCHGGSQYVDTLTVALPQAPRTVRAGSTTSIPATVSRSGAPAGGVAVYLRLQHGPGGAATYNSGRTAPDGRIELRAAVPRQARGPLRVTVEAVSPLLTVPCYGELEEHGVAVGDWGRVTS